MPDRLAFERIQAGEFFTSRRESSRQRHMRLESRGPDEEGEELDRDRKPGNDSSHEVLVLPMAPAADGSRAMTASRVMALVTTSYGQSHPPRPKDQGRF